MAVLPGSLDYLYYNGVLDSIPYEAYDMPMKSGMTQPTMNGSEYLKAAQQGFGYQAQAGLHDSFVRQNPVAQNPDAYSPYGSEAKSIREEITNATRSVNDTHKDKSMLMKGLIAGGVILTTLACILCRKKPAKP